MPLVPPDARTPTGYRLYGEAALVRLGLVRTLAREASVAEVAGAHASALDVRIRERQRAVLHRVAGRGTVTAEEIELMHRLAQPSGAERRRLVSDFIDETFAGLDLGPDFLPMLRCAMPDLPDEPAQGQVDAWVVLAELTQDPDFRASVRRAAIDQTRAIGEAGKPGPEVQEAMVALMRDRVEPAAEAGIPPDSSEARPIVEEVAAAWARHVGRPDGPEFRAWLADRLEASSDRRYERYWQLLAVINGWEQASGLTAAAGWLLAGLRAG